jgi:RNA polymerase subunit RPABC4/transcription elongation factor Spt4
LHYVIANRTSRKTKAVALIVCTECNAQVSDQAKACPQCGATKFKPRPPKPKTNWKLIAVVSFLGTIAVGIMFSQQNEERAAAETAKTPEQRAKEAKAKSEELQQQTLAANAVKVLKTSMKDPTAFTGTAVYGGANGAACITYRAKNSYGAIFPGKAVALKSGTILIEEKDRNRFVEAWNIACANGGPDFKVIVDLVLRE